ncbi:DUF1905 domain-containing protein [Solicola gregarius]|uniref:DUF1905 domain-containing protein n=1 Tax=Solicola gregarius TaxID=2908642 RepID=A0AA46YKG0_9ACTN|nr:DUF1905 domain-containing protein [Solicola gregarius]UYM05730.1 DUF1905 domain-containing protein [Solicola gregarius]
MNGFDPVGPAMDLSFSGRVIEWRGPAPYYFVPVPDEECEDVRALATVASYGWGVIPVVARIGDVDFETSLFPKDGGYLLPLKDAVRKPATIGEGDEVRVQMAVRT